VEERFVAACRRDHPLAKRRRVIRRERDADALARYIARGVARDEAERVRRLK
jgi:hypothetical protein